MTENGKVEIGGTGTNGTLMVKNEKVTIEEEDERPEAGKFRTILPQVLASTAKNFLLLDLGLAVAFPTIVIPALRQISSHADHSEKIGLSAVQASWLGSIPYICQPIGSLLSGLLTEPIGRKKSMILVNIPHIIAWTLLWYATSLEQIFIAVVLLGLGVGFMEAPIVTYVGEISQPSIRGILTCCAGVSVMIGITIVYFLGTVTPWRIAAALCLTVPLATMVAICFVPETPMWLLSKKRNEEALKSLQWLRGWVSPSAVSKEFEDISRYSEFSNKCAKCQKNDIKCDHPPATTVEKLQELTRKRTLKPFILVMIFFVFTQFSGLHSMRPYLVQIFKAYRIPEDPGWATVIVGFLGLMANIVCMCIIRIVGKRKMALVSMLGTMTSCLALGFYGYYNLPLGLSSFEIPEYEYGRVSAIPMYLIYSIAFFTSLGIASVPWMLLSEVFPFKSRGFATGITAAINYAMTFVTTKTYYNLEKGLGLPGVIWFYGIIDILGLFFIFFFIPETERRTLEDIETHFSDNKRKLTDIKIKKLTNGKDAKNGTIPNNKVGAISETVVTEKETKKNQDGCDNRGFVAN